MKNEKIVGPLVVAVFVIAGAWLVLPRFMPSKIKIHIDADFSVEYGQGRVEREQNCCADCGIPAIFSTQEEPRVEKLGFLNPVHCTNLVLDEDEVDIDCGGIDCDGCADGKPYWLRSNYYKDNECAWSSCPGIVPPHHYELGVTHDVPRVPLNR